MTEAEWLAATDPGLMLEFLRRKASDRKLRLFACGCCRRVWRWVIHECSRQTVMSAERLADSGADEAEWVAAQTTAIPQFHSQRGDGLGGSRTRLAATAVHACVDRNPFAAASRASGQARSFGNRTREKQTQAKMLGCIIGNPFRPVAVDPEWLTSTVVALAAGIYAERAFDRLPILADALQDAGCENADILAHCRGDGPHARGCWVVDLVLGKS